MKLQELAQLLSAKLILAHQISPELEITGLCPLNSAEAGHVSFFTNTKFKNDLFQTRASAVIVKSPIENLHIAQLVHSNPQAAMAVAGQLFYKRTHSYSGQSELAFVSSSASVHPTAVLYPFCYVGDSAQIAEQVIIYPQVYVGENCKVGAGSILFPGVVLMAGTQLGQGVMIHGGAVLGGDGFGFAPTGSRLEKIPQTGYVRIDADVEIGSLCSIDRATFEKTHLKQGVKLDSHVHVGHNVEVGENSMLCAQVGIAGSTKIGKNFIAAGQAGIAPGLEVGDGVILGGQCGLTASQELAGEYHGMPAIPAQEWRRQAVLLRKLPELVKEIRELKKEIAEIKSSARA
ncbi:MAG: UDP-3-O-(3-hydroxymyristoyl)glucosamine N-acyltransferase [Oligoflexales bacterium]|nr:UDP-3-O-(3-hydroxymyristoyl)glucosamine N-acyltransferase [Oligoflexales bacterium]